MYFADAVLGTSYRQALSSEENVLQYVNSYEAQVQCTRRSKKTLLFHLKFTCNTNFKPKIWLSNMIIKVKVCACKTNQGAIYPSRAFFGKSMKIMLLMTKNAQILLAQSIKAYALLTRTDIKLKEQEVRGSWLL